MLRKELGSWGRHVVGIEIGSVGLNCICHISFPSLVTVASLE